VEGSTYDSGTESWTKTFAPGETIRLWAIGNVSGGKANGLIKNVHLLFAYGDPDPAPTSITINRTTTHGLGGFVDVSLPDPVVHVRTVTDGSIPTLPHGRSLPSHSEYGPGVHWQDYALGDFTLTDSPLGDFIKSFPSPDKPNAAQINAYDIVITGPSSVHFDLYGIVYKHGCGADVFAPFSHDAVAGTGSDAPVPEPGTLVLLGAFALVGAFWLRRRRVTSK